MSGVSLEVLISTCTATAADSFGSQFAAGETHRLKTRANDINALTVEGPLKDRVINK